jgi:hypothetical protein
MRAAARITPAARMWPRVRDTGVTLRNATGCKKNIMRVRSSLTRFRHVSRPLPDASFEITREFGC